MSGQYSNPAGPNPYGQLPNNNNNMLTHQQYPQDPRLQMQQQPYAQLAPQQQQYPQHQQQYGQQQQYAQGQPPLPHLPGLYPPQQQLLQQQYYQQPQAQAALPVANAYQLPTVHPNQSQQQAYQQAYNQQSQQQPMPRGPTMYPPPHVAAMGGLYQQPPMPQYHQPQAYVNHAAGMQNGGGSGRSHQQPAARYQPQQQSIQQSEKKQRSELEYPCRALFIRNLPYDITNEELFAEFSPFGEIRDHFVMVERRGMGFVTYFDLRSATKAKETMTREGRKIKDRKIDVHYSIPKNEDASSHSCDREKHQGTILLTLKEGKEPLNDVKLHELFDKYKSLKVIRNYKQHTNQRFLEFWDSRDCQNAVDENQRAEVCGGFLELRFAWDNPLSKRTEVQQNLLEMTGGSGIVGNSGGPVRNNANNNDRRNGNNRRETNKPYAKGSVTSEQAPKTGYGPAVSATTSVIQAPITVPVTIQVVPGSERFKLPSTGVNAAAQADQLLQQVKQDIPKPSNYVEGTQPRLDLSQLVGVNVSAFTQRQSVTSVTTQPANIPVLNIPNIPQLPLVMPQVAQQQSQQSTASSVSQMNELLKKLQQKAPVSTASGPSLQPQLPVKSALKQQPAKLVDAVTDAPIDPRQRKSQSASVLASGPAASTRNKQKQQKEQPKEETTQSDGSSSPAHSEVSKNPSINDVNAFLTELLAQKKQ